MGVEATGQCLLLSALFFEKMPFTKPSVSFRLDWLAPMTLLFVFSFPVLGLQIGSTVFCSYVQLGISAQVEVIRLAGQTTC